MRPLLLATLAVATLAAAASAQAPRATHTLEFDGGVAVKVVHNQLAFGQGATLEVLMSKDDRGKAMRQFFNRQGFADRVGATFELTQLGSLAGNQLDPGVYKLGFRIDDDLVWSLDVATEEGEKVFSTALTIEKVAEDLAERLVIQPLAEDNAETTGELLIRFGPLSAKLPFRAKDKE